MPPPTTSVPVDWYPARILRKHRRPDDDDEQQRQREPNKDMAIATSPSSSSSSSSSSSADHHQQREKFALVVLNQPLRDIPTLKRLWDNSSWSLAADGGANRLLDVLLEQQQDQEEREDGGQRKRKRLRRQDDGQDGQDDDVWHLQMKNKLDIIIGDLDSLSSEARTYFTKHPPDNNHNRHPTQIIHDPDQESTDFGKALNYIHAHTHARPLDIVVLGGLGGRVDQGLSQLHHLYLYQKDPAYAQGRLFLVSENSLTFLLKGSGDGGEEKKRLHRIYVREERGGMENDDVEEVLFDKYVGIIPIKEPSVITTKGLEWDVTNWETEFGGRMSTSNHVLPGTKVVEVETVKDVLFTIALKKSE